MEPHDPALEPGVSLALARTRAAMLSHISYSLELTLSADVADPVTGRITVRFTTPTAHEVVFDFAAAQTSLRATRVGGLDVVPTLASEHIVVPIDVIRPGENVVVFDFISDASVLNRGADLVYSLFVPARARLAFPCFDQPDLKARFTLTLDIPAGWQAVSNTPIDTDAASEGRHRVRFRETEPLATYLFAFAAGLLAVEHGSRDGRLFRVWHREHDRKLIDGNLDAILDLHASALSWLESYTGIPYPFSQFDTVLVPSFQFSGMEHPGAIFYNAGRLLLESSASEHEHLTRASLIAHETAHMWFGDLVTMRWFDDVWLKEVFANFVAEKVLAKVFPDQDHALRFFLANYPSSYAVDRSEGPNAIRQPLENLSDAGQLYGPIIYLKAPIVFRQLELILGEDRFRDGVRRYLSAHRFGNATWNDLLSHLTSGADTDLEAWSSAWIDQAGRPIVRVETSLGPGGRLAGLVCRASDPAARGRIWPQRIDVALGYADRIEHVPLTLLDEMTTAAVVGERPAYVLAGGAGLGYGRFPLDRTSCQWLLDHVEHVPDALTRGVAWVTLWDELLEGSIPAIAFLRTAVRALARETDGQNIERLLSTAVRAFWTFLSVTERDDIAAALEGCVAERLRSARTTTERASWFAALRQVTITGEGCAQLERLWRREESVAGLPLSEGDETTLAFELAVRSVANWREILDVQRERIQDPERRARFTFIAPALSSDASEREATFTRFGDRRARAREPWVLTAMSYLSHPLRQAHARRFIRPGLALLPEIKQTGDIFFPARWAEAVLGGHASPAAAAIVRQCLTECDDWPLRLRNVILVAADLLFRAGRPPQ